MRALPLILIGAISGASAMTAAAAPPDPVEHLCLERPSPGAGVAAVIQGIANEQGKNGWMLAAMTIADKSLVVCFARRPPLPTPTVTRLPADAVSPDLSGNWNDEDSKITHDMILEQCFTRPAWLKGKTKPAIRTGRLINMTDEHLDGGAILRAVETALVGSPAVRVLTHLDDTQTTGATADFILTLRVGSILDQVEGERVKAYAVTAQVIDTASAEVVCSATTQIKKKIVRPGSAW